MIRERPASAASSLKITIIVSQKSHPLLFAFIQQLSYGRASASLRDLLEKALQQSARRHDRRGAPAKSQHEAAPCPAPTRDEPRSVAVLSEKPHAASEPPIAQAAHANSPPAALDPAEQEQELALNEDDAALILSMGAQF